MPERDIGRRFATEVDRYLRREDTFLAQALKGICSLQGEEYRNSKIKRELEVLITTPAFVLTVPAIAILGVLAKLEDGHTMLYVRERVGKDGEPVDLVKIRTMKPSSDLNEVHVVGNSIEPEDDPRNTRLGRKIRAYELDEFPQFFQILRGELSLVGIRCLSKEAIDFLKEVRPADFSEWYESYVAGTPGLLNLHSAVSKHRKDDSKRMHLDLLYARKASLGLDLFIIYRTSLRILRRVEEKARKKFI